MAPYSRDRIDVSHGFRVRVEDEFEDALKMTFEEFVNKLPMIECKDVESRIQPGLVRKCWQLIPELKAENRKPRCLKLELKAKSDLWRILMRAPGSSIEIQRLGLRRRGFKETNR